MLSQNSKSHHDQSPSGLSNVGNIIRPVYNRTETNKAGASTKEDAKTSYSVKYLGIVDGSMGILSRKLEMKQMARNLNQSVGGASSLQGYKPNLESQLVIRNALHPTKEPKKIIVDGTQVLSFQKVIRAPILKKRYA